VQKSVLVLATHSALVHDNGGFASLVGLVWKVESDKGHQVRLNNSVLPINEMLLHEGHRLLRILAIPCWSEVKRTSVILKYGTISASYRIVHSVTHIFIVIGSSPRVVLLRFYYFSQRF